MSEQQLDYKKIIADVARQQASTEGHPFATDEAGQDPDLAADLIEHKQQFQIQCLREELEEIKDTYKLRLQYAGKIFGLVGVWLLGVVLAVFLNGFSWKSFHLSDTVLIAFITSATGNVLGMFLLVAKWMFPSGRTGPNRADLHVLAQGVNSKSKPARKKTTTP